MKILRKTTSTGLDSIEKGQSFFLEGFWERWFGRSANWGRRWREGHVRSAGPKFTRERLLGSYLGPWAFHVKPIMKEQKFYIGLYGGKSTLNQLKTRESKIIMTSQMVKIKEKENNFSMPSNVLSLNAQWEVTSSAYY